MRYEIRHYLDGKYNCNWIMDSETELEQKIKTDKIVKLFSKGKKRSRFVVNKQN